MLLHSPAPARPVANADKNPSALFPSILQTLATAAVLAIDTEMTLASPAQMGLDVTVLLVALAVAVTCRVYP